jgi:hypothetical protein
MIKLAAYVTSAAVMGKKSRCRKAVVIGGNEIFHPFKFLWLFLGESTVNCIDTIS